MITVIRGNAVAQAADRLRHRCALIQQDDDDAGWWRPSLIPAHATAEVCRLVLSQLQSGPPPPAPPLRLMFLERSALFNLVTGKRSHQELADGVFLDSGATKASAI